MPSFTTALLLVGLWASAFARRDGPVNGPRREHQPPAATKAAPPSAFRYRKVRTLDLTGANPRDSIVLTATGARADSLAVSMTFYVGGRVAHRERWPGADELYEEDLTKHTSATLVTFMTRRLDDILARVKRQPIDAELVQQMGDAALLGRIRPRPTHQIVLSYSFESSTFLVWHAARKQLVVFMECC